MNINEAISHEELVKKGERLKKLLSPHFDTLYVIPDFDVFLRDNEPLQNTILFADDDDNTFSVNYTMSGKMYSVDFWKKNAIGKPSVTLYVTDSDVEDIISVIPQIAKSPTKKIDLDALLKRGKKRSLAESLNLERDYILNEMKLTDSKPEKRYGNTKDNRAVSNPETVFDDLKVLVNMVIKGTQNALIVTGSPGIGKSSLVLKQLDKAGLKRGVDYLYVSGRSTAHGVYIDLYENMDKIIVFNDCDSAILDKDALSVLSAALDSNEPRTVSWRVGKPLKDTRNKSYPKEFNFKGKIIFISNLPLKTLDKALKDRGFLLEISLSRDEMLDHMRKELVNIQKNVPFHVRLKALQMVEDISRKYKLLEMSMRTLERTIKILQEVPDEKRAEHLIKQQCSFR